MTSPNMEKQPFYGWSNVVICFLCYFLVYGIVFYGFSVIFPAMVKAMGWKRGDASIAQTIRVLVMGLRLPHCRLYDRPVECPHDPDFRWHADSHRTVGPRYG